jgi:hypothetical protein
MHVFFEFFLILRDTILILGLLHDFDVASRQQQHKAGYLSCTITFLLINAFPCLSASLKRSIWASRMKLAVTSDSPASHKMLEFLQSHRPKHNWTPGQINFEDCIQLLLDSPALPMRTESARRKEACFLRYALCNERLDMQQNCRGQNMMSKTLSRAAQISVFV